MGYTVRVTTVCHGSDSNHIPAAAGPVLVTAGLVVVTARPVVVTKTTHSGVNTVAVVVPIAITVLGTATVAVLILIVWRKVLTINVLIFYIQ